MGRQIKEGDTTIEIQTDKDETKDCPCTFPGCEVVCRVTKFYAPAKARCSEHEGKATSGIREATLKPEPTDFAGDVQEYKPNKSLADLRCPFDDHPLKVLAIHDEIGCIDFGCPECQANIEIRVRWAMMTLRSVPEDLRPLVQELNERQQERAVEWGMRNVGE